MKFVWWPYISVTNTGFITVRKLDRGFVQYLFYDGLSCCCACPVRTESLLNCVACCVVLCCVVLVKAYSGFGSLAFCSSINKFCCCSTCTWENYQQFITFPFLHARGNWMVCSGLPYSCVLLRIRNANAERELFVFTFLTCSLCLISVNFQFDQHRIYCLFCIVIYKFR